jgi:hypothetical protein
LSLVAVAVAATCGGPVRAASAPAMAAGALATTTAAASANASVTTPAAASANPTATSVPELALYGVLLKDAQADALVAAAVAAGAQLLDQPPGTAPTLNARGAGVPALQRLTVVVDGGVVASAQFVIKPYGQDNEALRRLLVQKYGLPTTADGARRLSPSFAGRFAPRGSFEWEFARGMKLIYRQPALGDATLSYTDVAREAQRELARARRLKLPVLPTEPATDAARGELGNKF